MRPRPVLRVGVRPILRPAGVAPLAVGRGAVAVAAGVDDGAEARRAAEGVEDRAVVGDLVGGGVEGGDVAEDAVGGGGRGGTGLPQPARLLGGRVPAGVPRVVVHARPRVRLLEDAAGAGQGGEPVGALPLRQALGLGHGVGLQDDHDLAGAEPGGEEVDPVVVGVEVRRAALGVAAAVPVGYRVRHHHGHPALGGAPRRHGPDPGGDGRGRVVGEPHGGRVVGYPRPDDVPARVVGVGPDPGQDL